MKITRIETLRCDAGWRMFSFLKVMTDAGIVGWSEFNESFGSAGLGDVVAALADTLIGQDPVRIELITTTLSIKTRQSRGGLNRQAIGAIENALLDIKGKALDLPVHALFGGAIRDRIPLYWSHCGSYRVRNADLLGVAPVRTYDDLAKVGEEVRARGFKALKTNLLPFDGKKLISHRPGFGREPGFPELNWDPRLAQAAADTVGAFRAGAGPEMGVMLDLNFNFKTEGFRQLADAVGPAKLMWLEVDSHDATSLALLRRLAPCPIASCETLCERRDFKPFFESYAMDVPIIDVIWNGYIESMRIAAMADVYEMNVATHNFYGHLSTAINAHFAASIPNLRIMETDVDAVPWRDDLVSSPPIIEDGMLVLSDKPGWGMDVNEEAVRAHPPKF